MPGVAWAQFRLVLSLERTYRGASLRLGRILLRQGRRREALPHLRRERRQCDDDPDVLQELGELFIAAGQIRRANEALRRLVERVPDAAGAHHNLAVSYFLLQRFDDGIRHCRRALKLKPDYPLALYNLALAHLHRGQLPRARRYAAKALTLRPRDENVRRLCRQLGVGGFWSRLKVRLVPKGKATRADVPDERG